MLSILEYWHCPFRSFTGIPCPSCGTTRALQYLIQGQFLKAIYTNPLGIIAIFAMFIYAIIWGIDTCCSTNIRERYIYHPLLGWCAKKPIHKTILILITFVLTALNMYWNYKKGF